MFSWPLDLCAMVQRSRGMMVKKQVAILGVLVAATAPGMSIAIARSLKIEERKVKFKQEEAEGVAYIAEAWHSGDRVGVEVINSKSKHSLM